MNENNKREQWLLEGNCHLCRKKMYCHKMCSARKKYIETYTKNKLQDKIIKNLKRGK